MRRGSSGWYGRGGAWAAGGGWRGGAGCRSRHGAPLRTHGLGTAGRRDDRDRLRRRRQQTDIALVMSDFEGDPRTVGLADIDGLAVLDVEHGDPLAVDEDPVHRIVVDRNPPALIESQQHVRAGDQGMRYAQVCAQVASDDHVAARREVTFRSVGSNGEHGLRRSGHQFCSVPLEPDLPPHDGAIGHTQHTQHRHVEQPGAGLVLPVLVLRTGRAGDQLVDVDRRR